jgi:hypothetical protein
MHKQLSRELLAFVESIEFLATAELQPGCDRRALLATFDELADRARRSAASDERGWLERKLESIHSRIDRRIRPRALEENSVSAALKARRSDRRSADASPSI